MPKRLKGKSPARSDGETVARYTNFAEPEVSQPVGPSVGGNGRCVSCEVRNGLPTLLGNARGHYVSRQGGSRMLVFDRRPGQRIRINGTTEVVVLEIHPDQVTIAIETSPDDVTTSQG